MRKHPSTIESTFWAATPESEFLNNEESHDESTAEETSEESLQEQT
jgi:hypothetical protein